MEQSNFGSPPESQTYPGKVSTELNLINLGKKRASSVATNVYTEGKVPKPCLNGVSCAGDHLSIIEQEGDK